MSLVGESAVMPGGRPVMIMSHTGDQWVLVDRTGMAEGCPRQMRVVRERSESSVDHELQVHDLQGAQSATESGSNQDCGDGTGVCPSPRAMP
jgi:hypothetical protein